MNAESSLAPAMPPVAPSAGHTEEQLACLRQFERKVLWLSSWMIHNANHIRPNVDGLKIGGHQASCASVATIMTALYFHTLRPHDRVAVKPHASPVFHAIEYLLGRQTRDMMSNFRAMGGAQSYPSRTKDTDDVDFSTGSVGLGAAQTIFASLTQDYLRAREFIPRSDDPARMIAIVGDAEIDEGNVFEALLEGWKHDLRNTWWIIDYNRQSLDSVVNDRLFYNIDRMFRMAGWNVITLKYGKMMQAAFALPGGQALKRWINDCPNSLYSALTFQGGPAWRARILEDLGGEPEVTGLIDGYDDDALQALMTNLAGHDMETVLEAFDSVDDDAPTCFIAYTVKGYGLPMAGHKDNHSGLMSPDQMADYKARMKVSDGAEWDRFAGLDINSGRLEAFLEGIPFNRGGRRRHANAAVPVPKEFALRITDTMSTQEAFGRILNDLGRGDTPLADAIVTASPDVTVSTNLGGWVNQRGLFSRYQSNDVFREEHVLSTLKWDKDRSGQHVELGIAENNLFLLLGALGLAGPIFGRRLLPIGTLYDPFIARGLDALNYACYQDARFMLVATPSGITLAPEGGAHQSVATPLIGMGQPGLVSFEPAYADELAEIMAWGFSHMQADDGGSVYLRLSSHPLAQPQRTLSEQDRNDIIAGGYWRAPPGEDTGVVIVYAGSVAAEAAEAAERLRESIPGAGLLAITSADRMYRGWRAARRGHNGSASLSHIEGLLAPLARDATLVTVLDGHPLTLSWLGSVHGHHVVPLGVENFGQCGNVPDLYRAYGLDADAILSAALRAGEALGR